MSAMFFLTGLGGGALEIPNFYALVWNNNVIVFALYCEYKENDNEEYAITLTILRALAPKNLENHDDEIIELVKESLSVHYFSPRIHSLDIKFKHKPQFILEGNDYKNRDVLRRL